MTNLIINIFVPNRILLVLRNELYKVAGKAGNKYGKSPEEDHEGPIKEPRSFWKDAVDRVHYVVDQVPAGYEDAHGTGMHLRLDFGPGDHDFEAFLKDELAVMAGRLAKDAWEEYGQSLREEILRSGPFVVVQMRDQVVEFRQPKLFKDEVEAPRKPTGIRVMSLR